MRWNGKIPYDPATGNVPHWTDGWTWEGTYPNAKRVPVPTKDNPVFEDILQNFSFARGRSAAYAVAESGSIPGRRYVVFLKDLEDMLPAFSGGKVTGRFTHCKRGQNYGTRLVLEGEKL